MQSQIRYKEKIIRELQDIPDKDMPRVLEIIHYLKTSMIIQKKKAKDKKR